MNWAATLQPLEKTQSVLEQARNRHESAEDFPVHAFLRDTGAFVLSAGLHPRNWQVPSFEIGYWCRKAMQGRGYVTEVVKELTAAAFRDMGAQRVEIRCDSRNERSRRVAERAGFRREAQLRCDDRANDGSLRDTIIYALLNEDFQKL
jgi:RimJ/RimL family protein N-acetyltransferase